MDTLLGLVGYDSLSRAKKAYEEAEDDAKKAAAKPAYITALEGAVGAEMDPDKKSELQSTLNSLRGNGTAVQGGRRRKRKGGKHTKKHRKGSKRARTGRKSSRL